MEEEYRFCIIVGAGFAGIIQGCTFLRKQVLSHDEFLILDRYQGYGGVWWSNTYPGAACDIPSQVYSISWAPNPFWRRYFATRDEIQGYLEAVADRHELPRCTKFNCQVDEARWNEQRLQWVIETHDTIIGVKKRWYCDLIISATGQFSVPKKPNIPGTSDFTGEQWHTGSWPANANLKNKRVAIIGTGPSATQIIPKIHKYVHSMIIYQRSPSFCLPRRDYEVSELTKYIYSHLLLTLKLQKVYMKAVGGFISRHTFTTTSKLQSFSINLANKHVDDTITSPSLREKLKPRDHFGCKRPLLLDDYYPIFNEPNVELVTDPVVRLTDHAIISRDKDTGTENRHEVDVLIWGTGYRPNEFGTAFPARGIDDVLLSDQYRPEAYSLYGIAIHNFPNFLTFLGPNSINFEISQIELMEKQALYNIQITRRLLRLRRKRFSRVALVPREDVVRGWTESLREAQGKHPANGRGCVSYYKTPSGGTYFYPYKARRYFRLIREVDFGDWKEVFAKVGRGSEEREKGKRDSVQAYHIEMVDDASDRSEEG